MLIFLKIIIMDTNTWYKATDQYDRGEGYFYNYFIDLGDEQFGYYSVSFHHPQWGWSFDYIEDDYDTIKDDVLNSYEFEQVSLHHIIKDCFSWDI